MKILGVLLVSLSLLLPAAHADAPLRPRPKLILTIVIDQFRADYLMRFERRFGPDGFRYLMSNGAYYPYGEYGLLQSMTCPGHATILSGAYPYQHGIPINAWFDSETHAPVYCVEDPSSPPVPVAPAKKGSFGDGRSPRNLIASTVGDELKNAGYGSRVYTVALKDRAAILLGGHRADLAIWFDPERAQWISSRYYLPSGELPEWMKALNAAIPQIQTVWHPEGEGSGYSTEEATPFAHPSATGKEEAIHSPIGDALTEQAAEFAFDRLQLGRGPAPTDLLAVSFSSHDLVGHEFGPNSREMEEMTLSEDRQIAKLLNHIRAKMPDGLDNVVIALTGDHGAPMRPEYALQGKTPAGRINGPDLSRLIDQKLTARFGKLPAKQKSWVDFTTDLNFYLNHEALAAKKIPLREAIAVAKTALESRVGVLYVVSEEAGSHAPGLFDQQLERSRFPDRSGDLVIIPKPYYMEGGSYGVNHHTGYAYDRTVPIILSGAKFFKAGVYSQSARVIDIAPTLTFISGTVPPSMSEGRVLSEALLSR
ncbi:MAG: alkaline phosphatase family protein [Oligoflexia bacterium]|nr:alkaline phosphatase family protein [Oligoflexia bacterium]